MVEKMYRIAKWFIVGLLVVASLWYMNTALVYPVGDPLGPWLVVKPFHGLDPFYGDGEHITGVNPPPGPPRWWEKYDEFHTLAFSHYECSSAWWEDAYLVGYLLTMMGWLTLLFIAIIKRLPEQSSSDEAANHKSCP